MWISSFVNQTRHKHSCQNDVNEQYFCIFSLDKNRYIKQHEHWPETILSAQKDWNIVQFIYVIILFIVNQSTLEKVLSRPIHKKKEIRFK